MKNLRNLALMISIVTLLFSVIIFTPYPIILSAAHPPIYVKSDLTHSTSIGYSPAQIKAAYGSPFIINTFFSKHFGLPPTNLIIAYLKVKTAFNADPNSKIPVNQSEWFEVGGTSFSVPVWAALIALADHQEVKPKEAETSTLTQTLKNQDMPKTIKFPEEGIPVLMYHSISTIPGNSLGVPVKQFTEEIEWLHRQNYHSLSLDEFYQALANKTPVPDKPILLTFDDGYSDNYTEAWPILRQNGFKATFFIVTNSVGPGMMNWDQLNELTREGNSIGSHTLHHLDLATLSNKQQESELAISKQEVENHLGIIEQALCFPSGRYNKTTVNCGRILLNRRIEYLWKQSSQYALPQSWNDPGEWIRNMVLWVSIILYYKTKFFRPAFC
ncbi:hypothetical protein JCM17380_29550 [Desulfosporosinus burensis]